MEKTDPLGNRVAGNTGKLFSGQVVGFKREGFVCRQPEEFQFEQPTVGRQRHLTDSAEGISLLTVSF